MTNNKSVFLKAGFLALALAMTAPVVAHASPLANDRTYISELNAAYGTHFTASQGQAAQSLSQN